MSEIKLVFTGTVGSGKTEAIKTLSNVDIISTDVKASDQVRDLKETTTIAMDYGEMILPSGETLALYGTPGQKRFSYMWEILARGALGIIIMVDDTRRDPLDDLCMYAEAFKDVIDESTAVFGVTHLDERRISGMKKYYDFFKKNNMNYPVMPVDARSRRDVENLVLSMTAMLQVV